MSLIIGSVTLCRVFCNWTLVFASADAFTDFNTRVLELPNTSYNSNFRALKIFVSSYSYDQISFLSFTGAIYTFLNTNFGVQNDFLDATLGPRLSLVVTFRWAKNLLLSLVFFTLIWLVLSPQESSENLSKLSFDSFKEFMINEKLPLAIFRQFVMKLC